MTNKDILNEHLSKVNEKINETLDTSNYDLSEVLSYLKNKNGKNIRALTLICTADAIGDVNQEIIDSCASIEIMHLATLIHDDIVDDAPLRRGFPSVQSKFGKKFAVISGDYLFTQCFILMSKYSKDTLEKFAKAISLVCLGEAMQLNHNYDYDTSFSDYKNIISGKTAVLFALATYSPTRSLGFDDKKSETLLRAGYYMGLVFQMVDDILDYSFDVNETKKEILKDLKEGVVTYPLIYALNEKPELKELLQDPSEDDITFVIKETIRLGGVEKAKEEAKRYYDISKKKFIKALGEEKSKNLIEILDSVYNRKS